VQLTPETVRNIHWLHDECGYVKLLGSKRR
jgi:uncharacterized cysteine cluster protein YcgN (CxxCxxCC family)